MIKFVSLASLMLMLSGCTASLSDYQNTTPSFNLKEYFSGQLTARGIVQDYSRKMTRRFCVDIIGNWDGNQGQLHETFYYADGEQQIRIWNLTIADDGSVSGTAGDVVGTATGRSEGATFNWQYTLTVPIDGSEYDFAIDDWMYMLDDKRMMNRSYMSKLGVDVAEISIYFDKSNRYQSCTSQG